MIYAALCINTILYKSNKKGKCNMKKLISTAIALAMLLSLAACGSDEGGSTAEADVATTAATEAVKDETTAPPETTTTTTTEETTTTEPVPEASPAEDFETEENDVGVTITKYKGNDDNVIIPAEINDKPVTEIAEQYNVGAFSGKSIKSVVIPEGVTTINSNAFNSCKNLTDIEFPESLAEITMVWRSWSSGEAEIPFDGTPWLEAKRAENPLVIVNNMLIDGQTCSRDVEIPDGVTKICGGVFSGCTTVTSVTIPNGVEKIDAAAFYGCERLTEIVLPDSVSFIGDMAFDKCTALENVTFPNNTVEMGTNTFGNLIDSHPTPWLVKKTAEEPLLIINGNLINGQLCTGDVVIPDSVKSIANYAFSYYIGEGISSVKLPEGITKIPNGLFCNCTSLKSINIPESVTEIGDCAFQCTTLNNVIIPNGVTRIGKYAFSVLMGYDGFSCKFENLTIPSSVTEIDDYAFNGATIKSVTLSEGLKKLGSNAFTRSGITELTLPDSLESISTDAFEDCKFDVTYKGEVYFPELYKELYTEINGQ